MNSAEITQLFIGLATVSLGAFLGAVGNRLVSINAQTNWKLAFYTLGVITILATILYFTLYFNSKFIDYLTVMMLLFSGILLLIFTYLVLDKKFVYKTSELDPIINDFTSLADKTEIRLFGGDLNFFGNALIDMDQNKQYNHLKSLGFKKISVLYEEPRNSVTQIRYGKILYEMNSVEMKFYNPDEADLLIRGRMKTLNGVEKLMIYSKIESGKYQTIVTDTANSNGALYNNIWRLVWSLANKISNQQKSEYTKLYVGN
jgi:hypothetical protein